MSAPTREQIMTALFALLNNNISGVQYYSRRVMLPQDAAQLQRLPALFLWERPEHIEDVGTATPAVRRMHAWILVVIRNTNKAIAGATIINPIIDSIEDAISTTASLTYPLGAQNLGGLVQSVKIVGEIYKELSDTDPNGLGGVIVPLEILIP